MIDEHLTAFHSTHRRLDSLCQENFHMRSMPDHSIRATNAWCPCQQTVKVASASCNVYTVSPQGLAQEHPVWLPKSVFASCLKLPAFVCSGCPYPRVWLLASEFRTCQMKFPMACTRCKELPESVCDPPDWSLPCPSALPPQQRSKTARILSLGPRRCGHGNSFAAIREPDFRRSSPSGPVG